MTVSGIDSTTAAQATAQTSIRSQVMKSVSDLLGMSQDDIRAGLKSGSSLADLAQSKGISSDQLVDTITKALQSAGVPAGQIGTGNDLTAMAQKIADHKTSAHHHHHHRAAAAAATAANADPSGTAATGADGTSLNVYA